MSTDTSITIFIIATALLICLLAGLIITLLFLYQKRQNLFHSKLTKLKNDYDKNLLKSQLEMQEQTFDSLAREIHDNINLSLTLAKLNLNTLDWLNTTAVYQAVNATVGILSTAISELTNISRSMNSDQIRNIGLSHALKMELEKLQQLAHLSIYFEVEGDAFHMDCKKELIIFRIVQEAFNNILKHSDATSVRMHLKYIEDELIISVRDDGKGFDPTKVEAKVTAGLRNMRNRATVFQGSIQINSQLQNGTEVLIFVPNLEYATDD